MNFGSGGDAGQGGGGGNATAGPDLDSIDTEQIAFQSAAGEDKLRLLPSAWPTDNLPPNTSSLLSVASTKGLVAAAAPDTLIIASTQSVRDNFIHGPGDGSKVKSFTPQATIPIPRVSQVAFSSDESCLVLTGEQGGGLAVYDTNTFATGGQEAAFQLATEGQSVRQLLPNPNPSPELSRFFGIVTSNGQLLLADLKERKLLPSTSGSPVFHEKVSCACWSRLGKQIVAGLADGTAVQVDQQGVVKATIPEPPQVAEWKKESPAMAHPVTSIFWLDTHDFLIIHTPVRAASSSEPGNDDSIYHLAHRDKQSSSWTFFRFQDPCPAFGMESRKPAHHFLLRLREWLSLSDLLILSSTASTDIGIFTRSKVPLDPDERVPSTGNDTFTHTQPPDSRRAMMPMGEDGSDTSPVGMALDLSVREKVQRPIPNEEMLEESPVELPAVYVLDNEGLLGMWYLVYNESVKLGKPYPDLVVAGGPRALGGEQRPQSQGQDAVAPQQSNVGAGMSSSTFGQSASANTMSSPPFGMQQQQQQASSTTFGTPSQPKSTSAFGQSQPSAPAFGGTSSLGNRQSPWSTTTPTASATTGGGAQQSNQPTFGSSTFGQSSFGQAGGGMGLNRGSVWGSPAPAQQSQAQSQQQQTTSTFGSASTSVFGGNASQSSPFLSLGSQGNQNQSPFAAAGAGKTATASTLSNESSSGSSGFANLGKTTQSPFATAAAAASNPSLPSDPSGSTVSFGSGMSFGSGSTNFGVSSFASGTPTPTQGAASSREESMADNNEDDQDGRSEASTLKPASQNNGAGAGLFGLGPSGFKLGSTFKGDGSAKDDASRPKEAGAGLFGKGFGEALGLGGTLDVASSAAAAAASSKKKEDESRSGSEAAWMSGRSTPVVSVKKEPETEEEVKLKDIPPAPSQQAAQQEEKVDDAPLPPDPTTWKPKAGALPAPVPPGFESAFAKTASKEETAEDAPLPPDPTPSSTATANKQQGGEPLAGSPPIDLGGARFSPDEASPTASEGEEAAGPPESEDEEGEWSDEEEGDEGSEEPDDEHVDDDDDDAENRTPQVVEDAKGLSAFEARLTPASPKRAQQQQQERKVSPSSQQKSTTPATEEKDSYTPAGMPKAPILFQPPQQRNLQARSPSPQRSATSPIRSIPTSFGGAASQQAPGAVKGLSLFGKQDAQQQQAQPSQLPPPSQGRTSSLLQGSDETSQPSSSQNQTISSSSQAQQQPQRIIVPAGQLAQKKPAAAAPPKPLEPEEGELEDEEDARIQAILAAPVEPTREVPAFMAHQDYVASGDQKEGLGGQIERVFRDINSMIDTLALNARALRGFVEGNIGHVIQQQDHQQQQQRRGRLDLEEEESWVLGEAVDLEGILDGIDVELEDGKLEDVKGAVEGLRDEEREVGRLRVKCGDVRKVIAQREDPKSVAANYYAPLPMESKAQQSELRMGVQRLQELLVKAEEQLSVLRAELASLPAAKGAAAGGEYGTRSTMMTNAAGAVPTVEAVTNTILKMTAMIEKRSGDIDVLESQIRKLGGPSALNKLSSYEDELAAGMKGSHLSSPHHSRSDSSSTTAFKSSARASGFGSPVASRLRASRGAGGAPPSSPGKFLGRKSLFDVSDAEVENYRLKKEGRRKAMERLREEIEGRGPRVVRVGQ